MTDVTATMPAPPLLTRISHHMRARRAGVIRDMIDAVYAETGHCTIIDLGGTGVYWQTVGYDFLKDRNVRITLANVDKEAAARVAVPDLFNFIWADAANMGAFADRSFDIAHSNSVIEHMPTWRAKAAFALEVQRLGARHYLQTPSFWFPYEPHYFMPAFQYLPKPLRVALIMRLRLLGWAAGQNVIDAIRLAEDADLLDAVILRALFPWSQLTSERIGPLTKSHIVLGRYIEPERRQHLFSAVTQELIDNDIGTHAAPAEGARRQ
jgi:hypothetical protein